MYLEQAALVQYYVVVRIVCALLIHYGNELCAQAADSLENHSSLQLH